MISFWILDFGFSIDRARTELALLTLLVALLGLPSCATREFDQTTLSKQETADGYCQRTLQPIGPTDPARPTQSRSGDYINYSGPCEGPSDAEQIRKQRRFEQFRFGRDFMPG
jgi:hypothetical protein